MISTVVLAHNEDSVIARTQGTWMNNSSSHDISVVVVCNGCADDTANVARRSGPWPASLKHLSLARRMR